MRALILRRVGLLESGASGPVIIGHASHADVLRLQGFLPETASHIAYLAAAVYAASEGLEVIVLDCRAFGGRQALLRGLKTILDSRPVFREWL